MPSRTLDPAMALETPNSKSSKKDNSSHSEKKRKRDHGDEAERSKKKHKSDKKRKEPQSLTHIPEAEKVEEIESEEPRSSIQVPEAGPAEEIGSEPPAEISPFHIQTSSLYLPLAPISQKVPLEGLCAEHLSPLILTYYPPFAGVLLSYSNPRLSEKPFGNDGSSALLNNIDEYAASWGWVTADFLLFKPEKKAWLEGYVNLQNDGHLGVVCWNLFNASIERKRLPEDWKWVAVEDQGGEEVEGMGETYAENGIGYWVDGEGKKVEGTVRFRVKEIESNHDRERGFLSIEGTMLDEGTEADLSEVEAMKKIGRYDAGRRLGGLGALGATSLGVPVDPDLVEIDKEPRKHRMRY